MKTSDPVLDRLQAYGNTIDGIPMRAPTFGAVTRPTSNGRNRMVGSAMALAAVFSLLAFGLTRSRVPIGLSKRESVAALQQVDLPPVLQGVDTVFPIVGGGSFVDSFGAKRTVGTKYAHIQQGVDVFVAQGQAIRAMRAGVVSRVGRAPLAGNRLWITGEDGTSYYYAGLEIFANGLRNGQKVEIGQLLGTVGPIPAGSTEAVDPPHLHLEIHLHGRGPVNPTPLLTALQESNPPPDLLLGDSVNGIVVTVEATKPLRDLIRAAEVAEIRLSGQGFRSPAEQLARRRANCGPSPFDVYVKQASQCRPPTAKPGGTHLRGIAVDFTAGGRGVSEGSAAHRWLVKNASEFDFVGINAEPWHWEYRPSVAP